MSHPRLGVRTAWATALPFCDRRTDGPSQRRAAIQVRKRLYKGSVRYTRRTCGTPTGPRRVPPSGDRHPTAAPVAHAAGRTRPAAGSLYRTLPCVCAGDAHCSAPPAEHNIPPLRNSLKNHRRDVLRMFIITEAAIVFRFFPPLPSRPLGTPATRARDALNNHRTMIVVVRDG
ncbi:hypothetical protein EVAR_976_1 [Eumeta japonica]|uniref:Uncharacterized protein n=1 Tax=Eumeta variegata TaxID=151549 RepID=A0A4C1SE13_EUMVA|nr:hypothetical protein EVAR_976_1 [Eumeta japonica]